MNSVATTFAMQPVCNAARAAHALRLDQYSFLPIPIKYLVMSVQIIPIMIYEISGVPKRLGINWLSAKIIAKTDNRSQTQISIRFDQSLQIVKINCNFLN
jgi:hypothetical protein